MLNNAHRVCLVGAGNVSRTHADALACVPTAELVAVCDTNEARARSLAEEHALPHVFTSLQEAIDSREFTAAHVLVPPNHHVEVAQTLIEANIGVLVEKPMGLSKSDCEILTRKARERDVRLGVNHNAVFYPSYLRLRREIVARRLGPLQHIMLVLNFTPSALPTGTHWMVQAPQNLAFESAIHPFSQVYDLAGPVVEARTTLSGRRDYGPDQYLWDTWQMSLVCERATAQVCVSYGGAYRAWHLTAICQDGFLTADLEQNRLVRLDRTRWGRLHEPVHLAVTLVGQELGGGVQNLGREIRAAFRPVPRTDPFFTSMKDSIAAFHDGPMPSLPCVGGDFGAHVVGMCEAATHGVAKAAGGSGPKRRSPTPRECDVVVLGGTGFIGSALVERMAADGMTVRVMARNATGLPDLFHRPEIELLEADIADPAAPEKAVQGARAVVHLAHGGSFEWEDVEATMVKPAERLAQACLHRGVNRLVYAGSIASLYLGNPGATITGSTPNDPRVAERGPYGWGKARSEELLSGFAREGLPLCIVRPAVVLGVGGTPFHSAFGIWRGEVHCVGWNGGRNPLPLVLASDVARAIMLALESDNAVGRTYNLAGDVRLSARECVSELRSALDRPLTFHPAHPAQHQALAVSKWLAKTVIRRRNHPFPSYRMIKSATCISPFDCSDVKHDLGWAPVADRDEFTERALRVFANGSSA
jgi:nucleoside-diphosphate-sugar epimerase/predicted dehydrogenase